MDKEKRFLTTEIRADKESRMIEGYALKFNTESRDLGGFIESIAPEALNEADISEVIARTDHDSGKLLARTESGTLQLEVDEVGLLYRFEAPNTTAGNDLLEYVSRGDISGSSFAFTVKSDTWKNGQKGEPARRTINSIEKLYDVSPVVTPAYPDTSVARRSMEEALKETQEEAEITPRPGLSLKDKVKLNRLRG